MFPMRIKPSICLVQPFIWVRNCLISTSLLMLSSICVGEGGLLHQKQEFDVWICHGIEIYCSNKAISIEINKIIDWKLMNKFWYIFRQAKSRSRDCEMVAILFFHKKTWLAADTICRCFIARSLEFWGHSSLLELQSNHRIHLNRQKSVCLIFHTFPGDFLQNHAHIGFNVQTNWFLHFQSRNLTLNVVRLNKFWVVSPCQRG